MSYVEHVREENFRVLSEGGGLRILSLNVNGIANKLSTFSLLLEDLNLNNTLPDIIFLSETKLRKSHMIDSFSLNGYKAYHSLRPGVRGGGGIVFYIKILLKLVLGLKRLTVMKFSF